jgi:hypothetical protein
MSDDTDGGLVETPPAPEPAPEQAFVEADDEPVGWLDRARVVQRKMVPAEPEVPKKPDDWVNQVLDSPQSRYLEEARSRQTQAYHSHPLRHEIDAARLLEDSVLWDEAVGAANLKARAAQLVTERIAPALAAHAETEAYKRVTQLWARAAQAETLLEQARQKIVDADRDYQTAKETGDLAAMRGCLVARREGEDEVRASQDVLQSLQSQVKLAEDASDAEKSQLIHNAAEALRREVEAEADQSLKRMGECLRECIPGIAFRQSIKTALKGK